MRTVAAGWEVRFGGFAGIDADLEGQHAWRCRVAKVATSAASCKRSGSRHDPSPRNDRTGARAHRPQPAPWAVMGRHAAQRQRVRGPPRGGDSRDHHQPERSEQQAPGRAVRARGRHAGAVRGIRYCLDRRHPTRKVAAAGRHRRRARRLSTTKARHISSSQSDGVQS